MFKCPHCNAVYNEPVTKSCILDEDTGDEIPLSKEMMMRVCPYCNEKFDFNASLMDTKEEQN